MKSLSGRVLCISTLSLSLLALFHARAEKQGISREQAEALVSKLKFQQGEITLHDGRATLHVPDGSGFLNGPDAQTVLVKLWGNPSRSADPLCMLMPDGVSPLTEKSRAVVVTYEPDGYVSDKEAEKYVVIEVLSDCDPKFSSFAQHEIARLRLVFLTMVACAATDTNAAGSTEDRAIGMRGSLVSFENAAYRLIQQ